MNRSNKLVTAACATLGLSLLPALSEAHPGHGAHDHFLSSLILTIAAFCALKQAVAAFGNTIGAEHRDTKLS